MNNQLAYIRCHFLFTRDMIYGVRSKQVSGGKKSGKKVKKIIGDGRRTGTGIITYDEEKCTLFTMIF